MHECKLPLKKLKLFVKERIIHNPHLINLDFIKISKE